MTTLKLIAYYSSLVTERTTLRRAIIVSFFVGIILNLINSPQLMFSLSFHGLEMSHILLTFLVPFGVSIYSSIASKSKIKPGTISHMDAVLKCDHCHKTDFRIHIGQPIEECPLCKKRTRWKITKIFSHVTSDSDMLKSLALFARHNPQPLFRVDSEGVIIGANPASHLLFDKEDLLGTKIINYLPQLTSIDLAGIISKAGEYEETVKLKNQYYKFLIKGVPDLNHIHIYSTNITEIKKAEQMISDQAEELKKVNAEISALNSSLEELVRQRTRKIKNQHTQIIKFAFKNAHEVRGPLARILGLIYLWKIESGKNRNIDDFIEKIDMEANSLNSIIRDLTNVLQEDGYLTDEFQDNTIKSFPDNITAV